MNDRTLQIDTAESRLAEAQFAEEEERVRADWKRWRELRELRGGTEEDHDFVPAANGHLCRAWMGDGYCLKGRSAQAHRKWRVNIYQLDQGYGGPEEGGWYYEIEEPELSIPFAASRYAEAVKVAEALEAVYQDHRYRYSVIPRGADYHVRIERRAAVASPQVQPHYE